VSYKSFHLYNLSLACVSIECVGLPSIVILGDRGEDRCRGLIMDWIGGDGWISVE
jgi:hypothetical protein